MPGLGTVVILLVANVIWLLLNLFASWTLKLSGEGANTISWGRLFHALIARGRKEFTFHCRRCQTPGDCPDANRAVFNVVR